MKKQLLFGSYRGSGFGQTCKWFRGIPCPFGRRGTAMGSAHRRLPLVEAAVVYFSTGAQVERLTDSGGRRGLLVGTKFVCRKRGTILLFLSLTENITSRLRVWQMVEMTAGGTHQREETSA
ncbi:hypothetical protein BHM03_00049251 [Ensete ventricosum]|nr:hypothetical protein BHM03_00049251 [Ensete ventricosum]